MSIFTKVVILKGVAGACFIIGGSLINDVIFYKANLRQKELEKECTKATNEMIENLKEAFIQEAEAGLNIDQARNIQEEIKDLFE